MRVVTIFFTYLIFIVSFTLNAETCPDVKNLIEQLLSGIDLKNEQDLQPYLRNSTPTQRQIILGLFAHIGAEGYLWRGRPTKLIADLPASDLIEILTIIDQGDARYLVKRAGQNASTLSLNEKRAVIVLLTQNWRLALNYRDVSNLTVLVQRFVPSKFAAYVEENFGVRPKYAFGFAKMFRLMMADDPSWLRWLRTGNQYADLVAVMRESIFAPDLSEGMQKGMKKLDKIGSIKSTLARWRYWLLHEQVKTLTLALTSESNRLEEDSRSVLANPSRLLAAYIIPEGLRNARNLARWFSLVALSYWGFYGTYSVIADPARPPIFATQRADIETAGLKDADLIEQDQLYRLQDQLLKAATPQAHLDAERGLNSWLEAHPSWQWE